MKFCTVDAFSDRLFSGNPAAVCVVDAFPDHELMQNIATEVNLSSTAFISPKDNSHFDILCFTPMKEIKLCGHATLAAAHVLWNVLEMADPNQTIYFDSKSGILPVLQTPQGICLNLPAESCEPASMPVGLSEALGASPISVMQSEDCIIVELHTPEDVMHLQPDFALLMDVDMGGIIVTSESHTPPYDFVSRFFIPREGINEDPVSGSAHCKLAPFWAQRLSKNKLTAYQASKRGGVLYLEYVPDRVLITGKAVTAFSGKFMGVQGVLPIS